MHKPLLAISMFAIAVLGLSSVASAQTTHVASPAMLQNAIQTNVATIAADRAAVTRVLSTSEARIVAGRLGLDLTRAEAAVATLEGTDLAKAAASARAIETPLSGGANTIVIGTTTLLLLIIILILVLN